MAWGKRLRQSGVLAGLALKRHAFMGPGFLQPHTPALPPASLTHSYFCPPHVPQMDCGQDMRRAGRQGA